MANEITFQAYLQIAKDGQVIYMSPNQSFLVDMTGKKGPAPGAITVPVDGVLIPLTAFTVPGVGEIRNLDITNYIEVGLSDGVEFYPMLEVGPEEHYPIKLSRNILKAYGTGSGTGTLDSLNLWARAYGGACEAVFAFFER